MLVLLVREVFVLEELVQVQQRCVAVVFFGGTESQGAQARGDGNCQFLSSLNCRFLATAKGSSFSSLTKF